MFVIRKDDKRYVKRDRSVEGKSGKKEESWSENGEKDGGKWGEKMRKMEA